MWRFCGVLYMLRTAVMAATSKSMPRYVEIAVNLGDPMFRGVYHDKTKHPGTISVLIQDDLQHVLERAKNAGVDAQIITAGSLAELPEVLELANINKHLYATAGCHPTRSSEMEAYDGGGSVYIAMLKSQIEKNAKIVAVGECGLGTLHA